MKKKTYILTNVSFAALAGDFCCCHNSKREEAKLSLLFSNGDNNNKKRILIIGKERICANELISQDKHMMCVKYFCHNSYFHKKPVIWYGL